MKQKVGDRIFEKEQEVTDRRVTDNVKQKGQTDKDKQTDKVVVLFTGVEMD